MRCSNCNVDLGESATVCPLCGAPAENKPPVLEGIIEAPYSETAEKLPQKKERIVPNKWVLRVAAVLCLLFFITGNSLLYSLLSPLILCGVAIYLFICGLKEKGNLLHSAVALLAETGVEALLLVLFLIFRRNCNTTLFITIVTIALTVILYALRSDRFTEQMKALFKS